MQSVQLQREKGNLTEAWNLLQKALEKFPDFYKLWLISAQIKEEIGDKNSAIKLYEKGVKFYKIKFVD